MQAPVAVRCFTNCYILPLPLPLRDSLTVTQVTKLAVRQFLIARYLRMIVEQSKHKHERLVQRSMNEWESKLSRCKSFHAIDTLQTSPTHIDCDYTWVTAPSQRPNMVLQYLVWLCMHSDEFFVLSPNLQTSLRGHHYKLFKQRSNTRVRSSFFTERVINIWNSSPGAYVMN